MSDGIAQNQTDAKFIERNTHKESFPCSDSELNITVEILSMVLEALPGH